MTAGTIYLRNNKGTATFDFVDDDAFSSENVWNTSVPRELNARTNNASIQPLLPYETVNEVFSVYAKDTGDEEHDGNLLDQWKNILKMKEIARKYREFSDFDDYVWLYVKRQGVTYRSYVYALDIAVPSDGTDPLISNGVWHFTVAILRHPYWETEDVSTISVSPGAGVWHGKTLFTGGGDVLGRVSRLLVNGSVSSSDHTGYYAGFKEGGVNGGFMHYWDADNGDLYTDASVEVLSGSRGGNVVEIDFGTDESLTDRVLLYMTAEAAAQGISTNLDDNRGTYLLLLRCYATGADSSYVVRLRFGSVNAPDDMVNGDTHYIDGNTTPYFVCLPIGPVSIPWYFGKMDLSGYSSDNLFGSLGIMVQAERYAGTGTLSIDGIYFVPYNGHLQVSNAPVGGILSRTEIQTLPNEEIQGLGVTTGAGEGIESPITIIPKNWGVPPESGYVVFVLDDGGSVESPASMTLNAAATVYRRHLFI